PIIETWLKQFASNDGFQTGILYKGQLSGMAGFHEIDWVNKRTSVGYGLGESFQGLGIMTGVVKRLIDVAFSEYGLNRVEIQCGVQNKKSRAIPERLELEQERMIRNGEFVYKHCHDSVLYSMSAREWPRKELRRRT